MSDASTVRTYWDTSMLVSFLTKNEAEKMECVRNLLTMAEQRQSPIEIVMSDYVRAELRTYANDDPDNRRRLDHFMNALRVRGRVQFWNVTRAIGELAAEIGSTHTQLSPPDCVHVATALQARVDCLWTYDGVTRANSRRSGKLASFNGKIHGLVIEPPDQYVDYPMFRTSAALSRGSRESSET